MLRKCYTYYESNALSRDEVDFFMNESLSCCLLSVCSCYLIGGKKPHMFNVYIKRALKCQNYRISET